MPFSKFGHYTETGTVGLYIHTSGDPYVGVKTSDVQTLTENGTVIRIQAYLKTSGSADIPLKAVIYDNTGAGGAPGALVAESSVETFPRNPTGYYWFQFPLATPVHLTAGSYYIGLFSDPTNSGPIMLAADSGSGSGYIDAATYPTTPNPFGTAHSGTTGQNGTAGGWNIYAEYQPDTASDFAPSNSVAPSISGTASVGSVLTCDPGTWDGYPLPSYTYQWQRDDGLGAGMVDIAGATASTYTVVSGDTGFGFLCKVTATNTAGSLTVASTRKNWPINYPLDSPPSWYTSTNVSGVQSNGGWYTPGVARNGVFYLGATPVVPLDKAGATAYKVYDFYGNIVSSGTMLATDRTVSPTAPSGGWTCGWYRIHFTGSLIDPIYGPSYGATNFCIIRDDANFPHLPAAVGSPDPYLSNFIANDYAMLPIVLGQSARLEMDPLNYSTHSSIASWASVIDGFGYSSDPLRERPKWSAFVSAADQFTLRDSAGAAWGFVLPADGAMNAVADQIYISFGPGGTTGGKITVYYPDSSTVVEEYDDVDRSAIEAVTASSAYIRGFAASGTTAAGVQTPTAIGKTARDGYIHAVQTVWPSVKYFEGPFNENSTDTRHAQHMKLYQEAIKAGNASAKTLGPTQVSLNVAGWDTASSTGYLDYCDEISTHAYNAMVLTDINQGRNSLQAFFDWLSANGQGAKRVWQTESTSAFCSVYRVHHIRHATTPLMSVLLWEQFGVPKERNSHWYCNSHGFWTWPLWVENGDGSLEPHAPLYRTLAEETYGKIHDSIIDFGSPGNNLYLGSIYRGSDGSSVAVVMAGSYFPDGHVIFNVTGATGSLYAVDGWGNGTYVPIVSGQVRLDCTDVPSYLRLPSGASVTVAGYNGFVVNPTKITIEAASMGSVSLPLLFDGQFQGEYGTNTGFYTSANRLPEDVSVENVTATWTTPASVNRVVIWSGMGWQNQSVPLVYDVQTTVDGSNWVTQLSVDRSDTAVSFKFGTSKELDACQYQTFWEGPTYQDLALPATVNNVVGVRLAVTKTSFGGRPDENAKNTGGDQGATWQKLTMQEIQVFNATPLVLASGSSTVDWVVGAAPF